MINWKAIGSFIVAGVVGIGAAIARAVSPSPAEKAPAPEEPKFDEIDKEVDAKVAEAEDPS